jgi:2-oxoglutarate ferredoxin oxidoreductase subunit gamma
MLETFMWAGFGGQGVMFAGQLLSHAAMEAGYYVTWIPSYGPEMRGGTAHCFVTLSDRPIGAAIVPHPSHAIVFNTPSYDRCQPLVAPGGLLLLDSSTVDHTPNRTDIEYQAIPAATLAESLGHVRLTNTVLLGALLTLRPLVPLAAVHHVLEDRLPPTKRNLLAVNHTALDLGADHMRTLRPRQTTT